MSTKTKPTMNRRKAIQIDTDFYVDKEDDNLYVFGNNSGFAYANVPSYTEGDEMVRHLYGVIFDKYINPECVTLSVEKLANEFGFTDRLIWIELDNPLTIKEIQDHIERKDFQPVPRNGTWKKGNSRNYHLGRVAYLTVNKDENPIVIDVGMESWGVVPGFPIVDGNHRLSAAIIRGDKTINAGFSGGMAEIYRFVQQYKP